MSVSRLSESKISISISISNANPNGEDQQLVKMSFDVDRCPEGFQEALVFSNERSKLIEKHQVKDTENVCSILFFFRFFEFWYFFFVKWFYEKILQLSNEYEKNPSEKLKTEIDELCKSV